MYCPRCNGQIQAEDCNLSTLVARCRRCQHVFRFADQLDPAVEESPRRQRAERPPNFKIEDQAYGFGRRIRWRWVDDAYTKAFAVFMCVCGAVLLWNMWFDRMFPLSSNDWAYIVFLSVFSIGLTFSLYSLLGGVLNRTTVEVDGGQLAVRHGPIPWLGNRAFEMADVERVIFDDASEWRSGVLTYRFYVTVIDREGRQHRLLETLTPVGAQFIAQKLQEWMIADPVPPRASKRSTSPPSEAIQRPQ